MLGLYAGVYRSVVYGEKCSGSSCCNGIHPRAVRCGVVQWCACKGQLGRSSALQAHHWRQVAGAAAVRTPSVSSAA